MSSRDRKQSILAHLAKSADGIQYVESPLNQPAQEADTSPPPAPAPEPKITAAEERKRLVLSHVQQTSESVTDFSSLEKARQKRIQDHVKKSLD